MKEYAQFMMESNTAHRLLQRITNIGLEALDHIALLLPLPEFPDETIKIGHPYHHHTETVSIRQIYRNESGEICFHWYGEPNGVGYVGRYEAVDIVFLLRTVVDYLTNQKQNDND